MAAFHYYGLILAGGRGTRFWPRSRRRTSKQVLNVVGDRSLIQSTVDRLAPVIPPERMWVLTNDYLRAEIIRQLPEVPKRQILAEPEQRNTAPAIGLAAHILHSIDPDAVMGVFPADHIIGRAGRFRQLVRCALRAADKGQMAVLGIQPRWAETGYGYIEFPDGTQPGKLEAVGIRRFKEKPDAATASEYLAAGLYYWNAGMFFWRAAVLLDRMRLHMPKTATVLAALPSFKNPRFHARLKQIFPLCDNISIDYGILEREKEVFGVACDDISWSDVGSWNAVYELLPQDRDGNVVEREIICESSSGNFVDARGKMVALLGVHNLVVVDTPDALLIADRSRAQEVSGIVKILEKKKREDLL